MRKTGSAVSLLATFVLGASALGAQVVTTTEIRTIQCVPGSAVVVYSGGDVELVDVARLATDTSVRAARVNVGGGSVGQNNVNVARTKSTQVSSGQSVAVDSSKVDIPAANSERNAVRVNTGGGSTPITRVNDASSKSTATDAGNVVTTHILCAEPMASKTTRKP